MTPRSNKIKINDNNDLYQAYFNPKLNLDPPVRSFPKSV